MLTITLLLATLAVPFALAVAWALAHLLANGVDSRRLQPVRLDRPSGRYRERRRWPSPLS
jgi:hypothetical protein